LYNSTGAKRAKIVPENLPLENLNNVATIAVGIEVHDYFLFGNSRFANNARSDTMASASLADATSCRRIRGRPCKIHLTPPDAKSNENPDAG
jgi:hypothetical protein